MTAVRFNVIASHRRTWPRPGAVHDRADELVLDQLAPFPLRQVGAPGDILIGELIGAVRAQRFLEIYGSETYTMDS